MRVGDILDGKYPGLLDRINLLGVSLFNRDGNDRLDPKHRALYLCLADSDELVPVPRPGEPPRAADAGPIAGWDATTFGPRTSRRARESRWLAHARLVSTQRAPSTVTTRAHAHDRGGLP